MEIQHRSGSGAHLKIRLAAASAVWALGVALVFHVWVGVVSQRWYLYASVLGASLLPALAAASSAVGDPREFSRRRIASAVAGIWLAELCVAWGVYGQEPFSVVMSTSALRELGPHWVVSVLFALVWCVPVAAVSRGPAYAGVWGFAMWFCAWGLPAIPR